MTLAKICGVRDPETALAAVQAGADFIGLMFAESKRKVTPQECHDIVEALSTARRTPPPVLFEAPRQDEVRGLSWYGAWSEAIETALWRWRPLIVGVFANQPAGEVNDIADAAGLDLVQLSGTESPEMVRQIERPVIKVLHVHEETSEADLLEAAPLHHAAAILLDKGSASAHGGTGVPFDWDVAKDVAARLPVIVAGGLTPETVGDAIARIAPWAVDVSSGVESDGKKDIEKIRAFLRAVKGGSPVR